MTTAPAAPDERTVARVRRFNRFYTRLVGALDEGHLRSDYTLTAVRVLYELAHWDAAHAARPTATDVGRELGLDAGYLSRLLRTFEERGLVARRPAPGDARQSLLALTAAGRRAAAELEARARGDVATLLGRLTVGDAPRLLAAMDTVESLLGAPSTNEVPRAAPAPFALRAPLPGELGWVVARHGALYAAEYGWDARFEGLVARIVADFAAEHDPARERCWIAEAADGAGGARPVGSVFLVRHPERDGVARLRLLLVEPSARGMGVGGALVDACTAFARGAGYHTITLWTNSVLVAARRLYEAAGYRLVDEAPHAHFGTPLVGQTWELALGSPPAPKAEA